MQPKACVNCNVVFWQIESELYCRKCKKTALATSKIIGKKRKMQQRALAEREATEELDRESMRKLNRIL